MKNIFYIVSKTILKPIFFLVYRPIIIGRENIPKDGSVVLAGNHTNWKDPLLLISVVNRPIHFLAKIELFKGLIGAVVKLMGCIPVDRKIHDKSALTSAVEVLNNGEVIGIFPEGTINRTEDMTLPFKIGAVKMAKDTDTLLVPFTITNKYKLFRKSVTIEFYKPYKVVDELDIENNKLRSFISNELKRKKVNN